jgi:hypothetical protein
LEGIGVIKKSPLRSRFAFETYVEGADDLTDILEQVKVRRQKRMSLTLILCATLRSSRQRSHITRSVGVRARLGCRRLYRLTAGTVVPDGPAGRPGISPTSLHMSHPSPTGISPAAAASQLF